MDSAPIEMKINAQGPRATMKLTSLKILIRIGHSRNNRLYGRIPIMKTLEVGYHIENTSWKVWAYGIYARVVDVSEIERVSAANE